MPFIVMLWALVRDFYEAYNDQRMYRYSLSTCKMCIGTLALIKNSRRLGYSLFHSFTDIPFQENYEINAEYCSIKEHITKQNVLEEQMNGILTI